MKDAWKFVYAAAAGFAAAGLIVISIGFALSGFNLQVFTMSIDRGHAVLGGVAVEDPSGIPLLDLLCEMGSVECGPSLDAPEAPKAPAAPAIPAAPEAPAAPAAPATGE